MGAERWATFDCYGTLVDWMSGIRDTLAELWPERDAELLLAAYHEIEPEVQRQRAIPYRQVLEQTLRRIAHREGLELEEDERQALAESLPSWPPFPEVPAALAEVRELGWHVAVLSNTDPDLLAASLDAIAVPVDLCVTAAEAGSYKPAEGHWTVFRERSGADPGRHVHVAASLFHDVAPCAQLGIPAVWINRLGEGSDLPRAAELPDLVRLPPTLAELVPG